MGRRDFNRSLAVVAALSGLFAVTGSSAHAQALPPAAEPAPATSPPPSAAPPPSADSADPVERGRVHYDRGITLFNEENYVAALFEFERAYELAPTFRILYNMGRIQRAQNNYAAALRSYARYLREGGAEVPEDRRAAVEAEIVVLKPRVAAITVKVNVDGADVYADDIPVCTATIESACVGKSPLQSPILVNGGRHKVVATMPGYAPATSIVSVVGSDAIDVKLDLVKYDQPKVAERRVPWGGWIATVALAAGAGVFGYITLNQSSQLADERALGNADPDKLESRSSRTTAYGLVADGLGIGAIVVGGISLYYTLKWRKEANEPPKAAVLPQKGIAFRPSFNGGGFTF